MNNNYRLLQVMKYCKDQLNGEYGVKEDEKDIGIWISAWEEIEILINSTINDLCNMHRHQAAKELEDCRDMIKIALVLGGFYNEKLAAEMLGNDTELSYSLKAELIGLGSKIEGFIVAASDYDVSIYEEMEATSSLDELYKIYKNNIFTNETHAMEYFKLNLKYSMILKAKKLLDKANAL